MSVRGSQMLSASSKLALEQVYKGCLIDIILSH